MKKVICGIALTLCATTAVAAKMGFEKADEAIAYRQAVYGLMATNFGDLAAQVQGKKAFDAAVAEKRIANVAALSHMPWEAFIPGSDKGDSEATSKVWSDPVAFEKARQEFVQAVEMLKSTPVTADALGPAVAAVGKTCKACHSDFKS